MKTRKFLHFILVPFSIIIAVTLIFVAGYASNEFRNTYMEDKKSELKNISQMLSNVISSEGLIDKKELLAKICNNVSKSFNSRITIVGTDGTVLFDTDKNAEIMKNHGLRPEVAAALQGDVGYDIHFSKELNQYMIYCGVPVVLGDRLIGVVRTSMLLETIKNNISQFYSEIILVGLVSLLIAFIATLIITRHIVRPLEDMQRGARLFTDGDFSQRIPPSAIEELGLTANVMNRMASELSSRIETVERERAEKERILSSMSEGVMALDSKDQIMYLNSAMTETFGITPENSLKRFLHEVIRVPEIQRIISTRIRNGVDFVEEQITLHSPSERRMQVHAVPLPGPNGKQGALLVFNDITRLRRLERTRQDFVANVSHELRTPITSILGFVETLLEGAKDDPNKANHFLGIIRNQTNRMVSIIEDLLLLSRLDSGVDMPKENISANSLLSCAVDSCFAAAKKKNIEIRISCREDVDIVGNPHLLEQALINLISNAIRYTDAFGNITASIAISGIETVISITDTGCGIGATDLPRIFERFYRVDKARSRQGGGTGLGLSIVKHIAMVHGGRVDVSSKIGEGSTFRIIIPRQKK